MTRPDFGGFADCICARGRERTRDGRDRKRERLEKERVFKKNVCLLGVRGLRGGDKRSRPTAAQHQQLIQCPFSTALQPPASQWSSVSHSRYSGSPAPHVSALFLLPFCTFSCSVCFLSARFRDF